MNRGHQLINEVINECWNSAAQCCFLTHLGKQSFENIMGKEENADNHFLPFPTIFLA